MPRACARETWNASTATFGCKGAYRLALREKSVGGNTVKVAYFDAGSGISGDMTVAALLDAGAGGSRTMERLSHALSALPIGGYRLSCASVEVGPMRASKFDVVVEEPPRFHRDWANIRSLIEEAGRAGMDDGVVGRALSIFEVLAAAEAKVHGVAPERVHFHEVGAIDSIVDIVAASWCLHELEIEACFVGPLPLGSGYVDSQHGRLPLPAPATVELLRGFDVVAGDGEGELVTPTGAAIVHALAKPVHPLMHVETIGMGAGSRRLDDRPNVLRVLIGDADSDGDREVIVIETDIDDMTPAALAFVAESLRNEGARDVSITPTVMKKGRAGMRLNVLCDVERLDSLALRVLTETSAIGLRYRSMARLVLPRRIEPVETEYGSIRLKIVARPDGGESAEPEFEDVARAALAAGVALPIVRDAALAAWRRR